MFDGFEEDAFAAAAVACDEDDVWWVYVEGDVVVEGEFLGLVGAEAEGFCDFSCAWCECGWGGFVVYVEGECVCVAVVGSFEFGDLEVLGFVSCHLVAPWVLCFWSFCLSAFSLVLPVFVFAIIQSLGEGSVLAA